MAEEGCGAGFDESFDVRLGDEGESEVEEFVGGGVDWREVAVEEDCMEEA